jgi:hypothetical protein
MKYIVVSIFIPESGDKSIYIATKINSKELIEEPIFDWENLEFIKQIFNIKLIIKNNKVDINEFIKIHNFIFLEEDLCRICNKTRIFIPLKDSFSSIEDFESYVKNEIDKFELFKEII